MLGRHRATATATSSGAEIYCRRAFSFLASWACLALRGLFSFRSLVTSCVMRCAPYELCDARSPGARRVPRSSERRAPQPQHFSSATPGLCEAMDVLGTLHVDDVFDGSAAARITDAALPYGAISGHVSGMWPTIL
ncbi:uncharacterized protein PHACADRAFT_253118 [Phanerochaete carnosa HHB-10118-sp]|uniref:Uncharacterized protein n=1 Tax=Phanerochaete carnosa (strain HHB-10118-sp) TaxID=650164 RepID=K5WH33_PHACS|nr:uncharacterized protein PHACADRAFT_253118 [Phanerochaete carnosa HHB-10118-sp]EKM58640.1 hypothetical protein PHACADRAFT_253118 [Phanerochaete carnosa HHB-10118-sp]